MREIATENNNIKPGVCEEGGAGERKRDKQQQAGESNKKCTSIIENYRIEWNFSEICTKMLAVSASLHQILRN